MVRLSGQPEPIPIREIIPEPPCSVPEFVQDVYKRQAQSTATARREKSNCAVPVSAAASSSRVSSAPSPPKGLARPVSYTHLDVYKRQRLVLMMFSDNLFHPNHVVPTSKFITAFIKFPNF